MAGTLAPSSGLALIATIVRSRPCDWDAVGLAAQAEL